MGHQKRTRILGLGVGIGALLACMGGAASAQTQTPPTSAGQDATEIDEVVVTGIRASIEQAQTIRRNANVVVDSITAEDIGKFSNENVAEALQRVPGVQIDREGGEGRFVSIRGLGPQFNRTTVHGRTAVSIGDGGTTQNRAFNFDSLATEFIARIDVFKTPTAAMDEGGLGGVIDIQTARPLDLRRGRGVDQILTASLESTYGDVIEQWNPRGSILYSRKITPDLGVLVGAVYQERGLRTDRMDLPAYNTVTVNGLAGTLRPGNIRQAINSELRERLGVNLAVQWRPADWEVNFDWLHTNFAQAFETDQLQHQIPPSQAGFTNQVVRDGVVVGFNLRNASIGMFNQLNDAQTDSDIFGLNVKRSLGAWAISADISHAGVEYNSQLRSYLGNIRRDLTVDTSGEIPSMITNLPLSPVNASDFFQNRAQTNLTRTTESELAGQLDFKYSLSEGPISSIEFGAKRRERETDVVFNVYQYTLAQMAPAALATGVSLAPIMRDFPYSNYLSGYPVANRTWTRLDVASQFAAFQPMFAILAPGGFTVDVPDTSRSFGVLEDVTSAYFMANINSSFMGVPMRGNFGIRGAWTDSTAEGFVFDPLLGRYVPASSARAYNDILPSGNLAFDIGSDWVLRMAVAKVVTRPDLTDLSPTIVVQNIGNGVARSGDPNLDPFRASQYDIGLEWYPSNSGRASLSASLFHKDIESFTEFVITEETLPGFTSALPGGIFNVQRPTNNGGGASVTGVELSAYVPFEWFLPALEGFGLQSNVTLLKSDTDGVDPLSGTELGVTGVAEKNYNVIAFYDQGKVNFRLSYTFRDDFLSNRNSASTGSALFTEAYGQLDFSAAYRLSPNWTFTAQGVNLTGEDTFRYAGREDVFFSVSQTDRRLVIGVRARF
jgi:TonB-dependent receptor